MRQYALLLATSVLIAFTFYRQDAALPGVEQWADPYDVEGLERALARGSVGRSVDGNVRGQVAAALAVYHIGPVVRSVGRLKGRWERGEGVVLCEPGLYLVVHVLVGWELGRCAWLCCS